MTVIGSIVGVETSVVEFTLGATTYLAARFDVDVMSTGAIQLGAVMDAIAAKVPSAATGRVYAWPVEDATPPAAIVGYPDAIRYATFSGGSDRATFPVFVLVGKASQRTARDALSAVLTGTNGVRTALDGTLEDS